MSALYCIYVNKDIVHMSTQDLVLLFYISPDGFRGDVKIRHSLPLPAATDCQWCRSLLQTVQTINYHIITSHTILSRIDVPYVTHLVYVKYYVPYILDID